MAEIKFFRRQQTLQIAIDRSQMAEMMELLDCNDPHQAFGMASLALSLIYRSVWEDTVPIDKFTERLCLQVRRLIENPPVGFREEDIGPPTPGCDCEVCEAIRVRNERKSRATHH